MDNAVLKRNRRNDRLAKWGITAGGGLILICVIGMLVMLLMETLPLFYPPETKVLTRFPLDLPSEKILELGVDEYLETGYAISGQGEFQFVDLVKGEKTELWQAGYQGQVRTVSTYGSGQHTLTYNDGTVALVTVSFNPSFDLDSNRTIAHQTEVVKTFQANRFSAPPISAQIREFNGGMAVAALLPGNRVEVHFTKIEENFLGESTETENTAEVETGEADPISAMAFSGDGKNLYLATKTGKLILWDFSDPDEPFLKDVRLAFGDKRALTALALVFGDESIAVGDAKGQVSVWFLGNQSSETGEKRLILIHELTRFKDPVKHIWPSMRNKSVLSLAGGKMALDHVTSERELVQFDQKENLLISAFSARGNGLLALDETGQMQLWQVTAPHPEGSWKVYFGKVWYENYQAPSYVWQSSASTNDFEPKFSLVPLIFGSIKGTLYAMGFAVPIAIFGAIYTNQFGSRRFRGIVKPAVEITAAVPSVIIGFLAALWLAPIIDHWLLAFFSFLLLLPLNLGLFLLLWSRLRINLKIRLIEQSKELYLILPILLVTVFLVAWCQPLLESWFFNGDFKQWIFDNVTKNYDQRNSIVISFALGFIVIPFIFTMTDDALSSVPDSLKAASVALGASRWQTTWKVLLPSASPGLFAGTILGMGRAIGETMIVLMATGNTPIIDLSAFNGMRTLSANIAVEIPEAPVGGSLYRVLFLSALILFGFTFLINSIAELFRNSLRKKYAEF